MVQVLTAKGSLDSTTQRGQFILKSILVPLEPIVDQALALPIPVVLHALLESSVVRDKRPEIARLILMPAEATGLELDVLMELTLMLEINRQCRTASKHSLVTTLSMPQASNPANLAH